MPDSPNIGPAESAQDGDNSDSKAARRAEARRRNPWNLLVLPLVLAVGGGTSFLLAQALPAIQRLFFPANAILAQEKGSVPFSGF